MRTCIATLTLLALAFAAAPAFADPVGDLNQALHAFSQIKSVHTDVTSPGGEASIDQIGAHKMRYSATIMGRQMQVVRINADSWVNVGGHWTHDNYGQNPMFTQIGAAQNAIMHQKNVGDGYIVTNAGTVTVNGVSGTKYHLVDKDNHERAADVIIGPNHLPLQLIFDTKSGEGATATYSQYNSVADFGPPQ
ncbi:MAG TPA: hypothetical protein VGZ02_03420 [Candidatus Baltobacteraceae bacterium]|jgi:hypothetical protein|nr:hypothetical protein [Candidatus Baltobacteraceae bacterium]